MDFVKKNILFLFGVFFILVFFNKFFINGLLPIPTDNIVGVYHPYRDFYSDEYPRGIPFQNVQVSDPVRQQYLWRDLAISQMKRGELPLWDPYNFSGYPLLANFQSAVFYPLNAVMFILPFEYAWSLLIISQPLLAFFFMFLFLRNIKISPLGSFLGSVSFAFSGFFVSWLEWGNVVSTGLWLPLVLFSIDKFLNSKNPKSYVWSLTLLFSLCASFFAGHLQTFFYMYVIAVSYFLTRLFEGNRKFLKVIIFAICNLAFILITSVQWIPTLQLINLSARNFDQVSTDIEGWFIPWQNLTQFLVPDFFGNPATLNYWGVWNYGEFIGYMGILPLVLALGVILFKRDKNVLFFGAIVLTGVILAYPSFISELPFKLSIPFLSTSQPTRLLYVVSIGIAVLSAIGFDFFTKSPKKFLIPLFFTGLILTSFWGFVKFNSSFPGAFHVLPENLNVTFSNLRLPTLVFGVTFFLWVCFTFSKKFKDKRYLNIVLFTIVIVFLADIFRFADKYTVFSKKEYLYPETKVTSFLKNQSLNSRIMEADARILPPNFTISFRGESIDGYDPLYLLRYGELIAAISRGEPNINPPFGFNRIITPQTYHDPTINALNVKYLLSLVEIEDEGYIKVLEEKETKIYENKEYISKAFFADRTIGAETKYDAIEKYFDNKYDLKSVAIIEGARHKEFNKKWGTGKAEITHYSENKVIIRVNNEGDGYLVLLDSFYPTWKAEIDGKESDIIRTNYNFRGLVVPAGSKEVVFTNHLF